MTFKSVLPFALVLTAACSVTQETTPVEVQLDPAVAKSHASALTTADRARAAARPRAS